MSFDLKKLVCELENVLIERGDSLDAPVREAFQARVDDLKQAVDLAEAEDLRRLRVDAIELVAALLSVITNVMTLLG